MIFRKLIISPIISNTLPLKYIQFKCTLRCIMKFRQRVAQFFYGRYGIDGLYYGLLVSILVLWILRVIFMDSAAASILIYILETFLLVWMLYRCMSRNIAARQRENQIFSSFYRRIKSGIFNLTVIKSVLTAKRRCACRNERAPTLLSAPAAGVALM